MPKQYFAYIPFPPSTGATELESAVQQWQSNVDSILRVNEQTAKTIANLEKYIEVEKAKEAEVRDKGQIRDWEKKLEELTLQLAAGPVLHASKRPVLLKHGSSRPLGVLGGEDPKDYVLFVVGHCAPGSTTLRETQSLATSPGAITANQLITRMASDGLPKDILHVKLLACFGAREHASSSGTQKAFSDAFWKELRGYCTSLVKMTAYNEAVLVTSFYKKDGNTAHKAYAKVTLGQAVSSSVSSAGRLSDVSKKYAARPCALCGKPVLVRCSVCQKEFCSSACSGKHLSPGGLCM